MSRESGPVIGRGDNKPVGTRRATCVKLIRDAGPEGITGRDLYVKMKALGYGGSSVWSCLAAEDMIYEENYANKFVRYFWCGE